MRSFIPVTFAAGASVSSVADCGDGSLCAIQMPAAWTAAGIQLEGSFDGAAFYPMFDIGNNVLGITSPAAGNQYSVDPGSYIPSRFLRVRSGTSASPVAQVSAAVMNLITRKFV